MKDPDELVVSSQSCEDRFQEEQWLAMEAELEPQAESVASKCSLADVIKMVRPQCTTEYGQNGETPMSY